MLNYDLPGVLVLLLGFVFLLVLPFSHLSLHLFSSFSHFSLRSLLFFATILHLAFLVVFSVLSPSHLFFSLLSLFFVKFYPLLAYVYVLVYSFWGICFFSLFQTKHSNKQNFLSCRKTVFLG